MLTHLRAHVRPSAAALWLLLFLTALPRPVSGASGLQAQTWTVTDGLPQNTVTALTQDRDGYLWVATRKGLARFDGLHFHSMGVIDDIDLSTLRLTSLIGDRDGGLWIGSYEYGLFYLRDHRLTRLGPDQGVPHGTIWDLRRDRTGRIWVATSEGPRYFDGTRWVALPIPDALSGSSNTVFVDSHSRVWIGTSTRGILRIDGTTVRSFGVDEGLPVARVFSIVEDQQGVLWVATPQGVVRYDAVNETFDPVPALAGVRSYQLLVDRHGMLWVATYGEGLLQYDGTRVTRLSAADGISSDFILSLLEDRDGSIWVGTVSGGMTRLVMVERELLDESAGLPKFPVTTVYQDQRDVFWVGTLGGGLVGIERGRLRRYTVADGLPSDNITSVSGGDGDSLWVGTSGAGAFRFEHGRVIERVDADRTGMPVRTVEFDQSVYFGGQGVLRRAPDGTLRRWTVQDGLGSNEVRALHAMDDHTLLIGTYGGGLSRLSPDGTLQTFGRKEGLTNPFVTSLHVDKTNTIWIGTYGGGLFRMRDGVLRNISEAQGLEDNVIFDIVEGPQQRLWLMTNEGLSVVSLADAQRVADGQIPTLPSTFVGRAQGITGIDGTDGNQPQSWLATDGRIWFATTHGVVIVDPATVGPPLTPAAVTLDRIEVNNVATQITPRSEPLRGRNLTIEFSTPELLGAARVRYQHRLVGYAESWSPAGMGRTASYTTLPPGTYRFEVRAQGSRGGPFGQPTVLTFRVAPRYYETGWFLALIGLLVTGLLVGVYRWRVQRMKHRERTLQQLVDTRTAALRHEMNERGRAEEERRALDDRMQQAQRLESLGVLAGGIAHDFNNLLVGVLGEAGLALMEVPAGSRARTHLQHIEQAALQASELTAQMLAYSGRSRFVQVPVNLSEIVRDTARLLSTLFGREVTLQLDIPPNLPAIDGDPSQLRQVVMNLLTNASDAIGEQAGVIRVAVGTRQINAGMALASATESDGPLTDGRYVWLTVEDDGEGMDPATAARIFEPFFSTKFTGRGLGLAAVQGIVRSHRGRINVESRPGVGTIFTLLLPAAPPAPVSSEPPAPAPVPSLAQFRPRGERRGAKVLIVDDERTVRDVARATLEAGGFDVLAVDSGEQAIEEFRQNPDAYAIVLLDVTLPGISGRGVFQEMRKLRAAVPILLTSGFAEEEAADLVAQPHTGFAAKPWRPQALISELERLLNGSA